MTNLLTPTEMDITNFIQNVEKELSHDNFKWYFRKYSLEYPVFGAILINLASKLDEGDLMSIPRLKLLLSFNVKIEGKENGVITNTLRKLGELFYADVELSNKQKAETIVCYLTTK